MNQEERKPMLFSLGLVTILLMVYFALEIGFWTIIGPMIVAVLIWLIFATSKSNMFLFQKIFFAAVAEVCGTIAILYLIAMIFG